MENKLITEINIEDKQISHFASFTLEQQFNTHHYFELKFNHDENGAPGMVTLEKSREFIGKSLSASFGYAIDKLQTFTGIVTKVELAQTHGYHGILVVSGYSPGILIDRGPDLGSYLGKNLNAIVTLATKDTPANDLKIVVNAARKSPIDYVIQYRESDFEFLNRLSAEYHEWFFYDGENLNFGKPDEQEEISLFYGRNLHTLQYAMEVAPIKNNRFAYNPRKNEMLQSESKGAADQGSDDLIHAVNASNAVYSKTFNQPSLIRVDSNSELKDHVENEEKASISNLLRISAAGDNPEVGIGKIAEITMSIREVLDFVTDSLGKFLITRVVHAIDGTGRYKNNFEGVVSTTERLPVKHYVKPSPDMQLADVQDNADPQGQGRIKVKFKWKCLTNDTTEWLRVVTPDAGSSDAVSKNRGFVFIPEKGDQVLVAFEEGNVARPIVIGSVYHQNNADSNPQVDNHLKSIFTKSGHHIEFNDQDGGTSLTVKDPSGNTILLDTKESSILITAPETITLRSKNIVMEASETITATAGTNITYHAKEGFFKQTAKTDIEFRAENIREVATNAYESYAKNVSVSADVEFSATAGSTAVVKSPLTEIEGSQNKLQLP